MVWGLLLARHLPLGMAEAGQLLPVSLAPLAAAEPWLVDLPAWRADAHVIAFCQSAAVLVGWSASVVVLRRLLANNRMAWIGASVLALLLACGGLFWFQTIQLRKSFGERLESLGTILASHSTAPLAFNDRKSALEVLNSLESMRNILYARILDAEGNVFAGIGSYRGTTDGHGYHLLEFDRYRAIRGRGGGESRERSDSRVRRIVESGAGCRDLPANAPSAARAPRWARWRRASAR